MKKRYFSLAQAESLLPDVRMLLEELMKVQLTMHLQEEIAIAYDDPFLQTYEQLKQASFYHKQSYKFAKIIRQLMKKGVFVKDPSIGLVDFYAQHKGREIFLCYQYPEENISYWHGTHEGFSSRKHVSLLKEEIQK